MYSTVRVFAQSRLATRRKLASEKKGRKKKKKRVGLFFRFKGIVFHALRLLLLRGTCQTSVDGLWTQENLRAHGTQSSFSAPAGWLKAFCCQSPPFPPPPSSYCKGSGKRVTKQTSNTPRVFVSCDFAKGKHIQISVLFVIFALLFLNKKDVCVTVLEWNGTGLVSILIQASTSVPNGYRCSSRLRKCSLSLHLSLCLLNVALKKCQTHTHTPDIQIRSARTKAKIDYGFESLQLLTHLNWQFQKKKKK